MFSNVLRSFFFVVTFVIGGCEVAKIGPPPVTGALFDTSGPIVFSDVFGGDTVSVEDTATPVDVFTEDTSIPQDTEVPPLITSQCVGGVCTAVVAEGYKFRGKVLPLGAYYPPDSSDLERCPNKRCRTLTWRPGVELARFVADSDDGTHRSIVAYDCSLPSPDAPPGTMFGCPCKYTVDRTMFVGGEGLPEELGCDRYCYVADGTSVWMCR